MSARRLVLGVIGHVDHGKTSLVRALTGMDTDRLPEERRRGISIALGFAHFPLGDAIVDVIDMPGHERFVRTMVSGATGLDAVLLVVAANEGVMPQTREHVDIAGLLGVRQALVAVTKADLAPPDRCAAVGAEAAALAEASGLGVRGLAVAVSVMPDTGLPALRARLTELLAHAETAEDCGFAYLPIDRAFSLAGHGTVVTGTLRRGTLRAGDEVETVPDGRRLRVRGLQVHGSAVAMAAPGQRVAANLRGVDPAAIPRGSALATPGQLPPSLWLTTTLRAVEDAPPLATGMRLRLLVGTAEVDARLRLLDRDTLEPGEAGLAQLQAATLVSVPARERFILRLPSPAWTVAGGRVLDPQTARQRRHAPGVLTRLHALAGATPQDVAAQELAAAGAQGIAVPALARLAGLGGSALTACLQRVRPLPVLLAKGHLAVTGPSFDVVIARLPQALAAHAEGLSPDKLRAKLPQASPAVIEDAVAHLVGAGRLHRVGGLVRLVDKARDRDRARQEEAAAAQLAEQLRVAGLTPPDPHLLAPDPPRRRLLDQLVRAGVAIRATDRVQKRELVFHREAVEAAQRRLAPYLAGAGLLVSEAGAALGISRKFSVPLLEHLDSIQYTRRVADRRVLAHRQ